MSISRRQCCLGLTRVVGVALLTACGSGGSTRRVPPRGAQPGLGRGVALIGRVWPGGATPAYDDGVVIVGADGRIAAAGAATMVPVPEGVRTLGGRGSWVGPGVVDAHVHLAFGGPGAELRGGLVGVRDLGAPPQRAFGWQTRQERRPGTPAVAVAGPLLTAPAGYPSQSWGADGFAAFLHSPVQAASLVRDLAADGVDLVKIALEPSGGLPVPGPAEVRAVVDAAHAAGLRVTAHALSVAMVERALDGGVDELAHTPTEPLPPAVVDRIAGAGIPVISTLQTFVTGGGGAGAVANAAALHRAGVALVYGTDLGNAGTSPGVDPRELDRLAEAGLGRLGALRSATEGAASVAGMRGPTGRLVVGQPADVVLLDRDPVADPTAWNFPRAVITMGHLLAL